MHRGKIALTALSFALSSSACSKENDDKAIQMEPSTMKDASIDQDSGPEPAGPVLVAEHPPLGSACAKKAGPGKSGALPTFSTQTISTQPGAAYMLPADLNGDSYPELLLTTLAEGLDTSVFPPISTGGAYVLSREGGKANGALGTFTAKKAFDRNTKVMDNGESVGVGFPNSSELLDIDNDGVNDWVIGAGFLPKPRGLIVWMKGARDGSFGPPKTIPVPDPTCWYHITLPTDLDGDGDQDFITSCHISTMDNPAVESRVEWFENPGDASGSFTKHAIGGGGGSLLTLFDLDEDGDQDVIAPQYFDAGALVWFEQTGAKGTAWTPHTINVSTGRGFIAEIADMNGDGRLDLVYGNHNNELASNPLHQKMGVYWFDIPSKDVIRTLPNWDAQLHIIYEDFEVDGDGNPGAAGAPGMLSVGDIDGDCDYDVAVSGDGDLGLYLFVQQETGFEKVELARGPNNVNAGEQHMLDMDGDGDLDLVWAIFGPQAGPTMLELMSRVDVFLQN